jgi:hypothetical protein
MRYILIALLLLQQVFAQNITLTLSGGSGGGGGAETDPIVKAVTGLVKSNGSAISAAVPGTDYVVPSGSVATLTTPRAIYGNNFNGSAALNQIIASTFGGTGNGFTQFTGPASTEKIFTLPNVNSTIATLDAAQTLTNKTFSTGNDITAALTWGDGVKQTFNPNATNSGLNAGSQAGNPSSLANGDLWYNSAANALNARINGATVSLGAGGGPNYAVQTLTDGATINWDVSNGINAQVTIGATGRTLAITGATAGYRLRLRVIQDGTGNRTITTWPANTKWPFGGTMPAQSNGAGQYDIYDILWDGTNHYITQVPNFQ